MKRNRKHLGNGSKGWRLEAWKWKVETGKLQNRVRVERIRPSSSRSVATAHGWTDGISLGSRSRLHLGVGSSRSRRCGRLTTHGWTGLTWQQLVATSLGSNRSWFQQLAATDRVLWWLVADLRVAGCGCLVQLFHCLCLCLWFVKLWLTGSVCVC